MRGEFDALPVDLDARRVHRAYRRVRDFGSDTIARDKRDRVGHAVIITARTFRTFFTRSNYRTTRESPSLRVRRSRSSHSSKGMAYLRDTPVHSLNSATENRAPLC